MQKNDASTGRNLTRIAVVLVANMTATEDAMNTHYRDRRKIDPAKGPMLGDGTPNDNDRIEIGPTQLAFAEWEAAGLQLPDLAGDARLPLAAADAAHRRPRLWRAC